jgi:hypothetical protein
MYSHWRRLTFQKFLMMEAVHTSEMLVYFNETTWHYIPEGCRHHAYSYENLKSHIKHHVHNFWITYCIVWNLYPSFLKGPRKLNDEWRKTIVAGKLFVGAVYRDQRKWMLLAWKQCVRKQWIEVSLCLSSVVDGWVITHNRAMSE